MQVQEYLGHSGKVQNFCWTLCQYIFHAQLPYYIFLPALQRKGTIGVCWKRKCWLKFLPVTAHLNLTTDYVLSRTFQANDSVGVLCWQVIILGNITQKCSLWLKRVQQTSYYTYELLWCLWNDTAYWQCSTNKQGWREGMTCTDSSGAHLIWHDRLVGKKSVCITCKNITLQASTRNQHRTSMFHAPLLRYITTV